MKSFSFLNQKQYQFLLQQKTVRLLITLPLFKMVYGFATFIYLLIFFSFFFTINASKKLLSLKNKRQILQSNQIHIFFSTYKDSFIKDDYFGVYRYPHSGLRRSGLRLCSHGYVSVIAVSRGQGGHPKQDRK